MKELTGEEEFNGLEIMRKRELVYLEQSMQQTEALRLVEAMILGNQLQTLSAMLEEKQGKKHYNGYV